MTNTQVLLTHKDDGLHLVVDELVGVSSLKVVDELDEVAVMVLAIVLGAKKVLQLTPALGVLDADLVLHQFLHETNNISARYALREECRYGCRRCAAPTCYRYAAARCRSSYRSPAPTSCWSRIPPHPFIARAAATSSVSIVDCAVSSCSPTLKMVGASVSATMYDGVNLSWLP